MKDSCCKEGASKGVGFAQASDASNVTDGLPKVVSNFEGSRGAGSLPKPAELPTPVVKFG